MTPRSHCQSIAITLDSSIAWVPVAAISSLIGDREWVWMRRVYLVEERTYTGRLQRARVYATHALARAVYDRLRQRREILTGPASCRIIGT